ncbi:restriction endonuclease, partial [Candidatus Woesearchaeota archaeon]|nr:restriction endonuclease [Candidatus Woesearchaeota archaeon]
MKNSTIKEQRRKLILNYAKRIYEQENRIVSKREIRSVFHLELYNYFKNIFELYQHLNIDVPLCYSPREYAINKIMEFVRLKSKEGLYPTKNEIEAKFDIHIYTYFKDIADVYSKSGVDYLLHLEKIRISNFHSSQKIEEQKEKIINYIKERNKLGCFAGVLEIQHKLGLNFYKYFKSPKEAYKEANIDYSRVCPIILGKNKEEILTKIALHLLVELGYTIKRTSIFDSQRFNKGPDIELLDNHGKEILVEIKAYQSRYWITAREIQQLTNYMKKRNISQGLFITTATKVNHNPRNIKIIDGEELIKLLQQNYLGSFIENIKWIQEEKVNAISREIAFMKKRKEIIQYII